MSKKLIPIDSELANEIASILMNFVCHNQKPYSKTLNKFIATGVHDIRAGSVARSILRKCQSYLDKE